MSFICGSLKYVLSSKVNSNILGHTRVPYFIIKGCSSYTIKGLRTSNFAVPQRTYLWGGLSRKPSEETFRKVDEVPEGFNLIYRTPSYKYFKWGYFLACVVSTSVLGIFFLSYDYERTQVFLTKDKPEPISNEVIIYMVALSALFIAVQSYATRVPMRIYNSPVQGKYIFVFNGTIPLTLKKTKCYKGEVMKTESFGIVSQSLPWNKSGYLLPDSQKIYLFEDSFRKPSDLHVLLGNQDDVDSE